LTGCRVCEDVENWRSAINRFLIIYLFSSFKNIFHRMKNYLFILMALVCHSIIAQNKLEVGLKGGKVLYPTTIQYKDPFFKGAQLILDGEEKIDIFLVDYYQTSEDYYLIRDVGKGLSSFSNARIRRVENGAIQVFEHKYTTTTTGAPGFNGTPGMTTSTTVINYYCKDKFAQVQLINRSKLEELVQDDSESLILLGKQKRHKLSAIPFYVVGGAIALFGSVRWASQEDDDLSNPEDTSLDLPPSIFVGIAIMWIPTIRRLVAPKEEDSTLAIIVDYNSRH
jgi:hypothetical protein